MDTSQADASLPGSRINTAAQNRIPRNGARFSFAPETPIHLQRSTFVPSSPTETDIDSSTMSSFGTQLRPISRSISVIVADQKRQERAAKAQLLKSESAIPEPMPEPQLQPHNAYQRPNTERDGKDKALPSIPPQQELRIETAATATPQPDTALGDYHVSIMPPSYSQPVVELVGSQPVLVKDPQKSKYGAAPDHEDSQTEPLLLPRKPPTMIYSPHSLTRQDMFSTEQTYDQPSFSEPPTSQSFDAGLCAASSTCCLAVICPCIVYGRTQYRLNQRSSGKATTNLLGYETANGSCLLMSLSCCFSGILTTIQRVRVRKAYGIQGGVVGDFLRSCCCCCCVLAQNENEIIHRAKISNDTRTAYASPAAMVYPPPPRA